MARLALAAAVLALLGTGTPAARQQQAPPVIFRSEVNYVEVDATVTDAQGTPVPDLTQADFDLLEDGKPQKIASFSRVDLPLERPERPLFAGKAIEPDVATNRAIEGRIWLIVLDDLHTDVARTPRVKTTARRFIDEAIGVNDVAAVVYTGRNDASQDFTNNTRLLQAAVDKFTGRKPPSATIDRLSNTTVDANGNLQAGDDTAKQERAFQARSAMASIRKWSEFMAGVRGRRKAMVMFGEGIDYDVNQAMGADGATASIVLEDIRNAIAAAQRGNVAIYTIDPRGLFNAEDDLIQVGGLVPTDNPADTLDGRAMQAEVRVSQESLRQLAIDTGGFSVLNTNDFNRAFDRMIRENSSYYLLGYYPANEKRDGRVRRLQVRVKRPGLTVRARNSYVAPKGKAPATPEPPPNAPAPAITAALGSPLPTPGLPMRAFAAAFRGTPPNAAIAFTVEVDAAQLDFVNRNGLWVDTLDVVDTAVLAGGKTFPGERTKAELTLKPATYEAVQTRGIRLLGQMELPPGRYQLRFAAGNSTGKSGSVLYDLEVPDFSREPLMMSGIAITAADAARGATIKPEDPLKDYLPGPPVAVRTFRRGDRLTLFGEVYDNQRGGAAHQVTIRTALLNDIGNVVHMSADERSSSELAGKAGGYGFTAAVSLADVPAGLYVIHVEAQGHFEGMPTVGHDIQIQVIP